MQTWDIDSLTDAQKLVLVLVLNTNEGCGYFDAAEVDSVAAAELANLGLLEVDRNVPPCEPDEVYLGLTKDGDRWVRSLPEGALA